MFNYFQLPSQSFRCWTFIPTKGAVHLLEKPWPFDLVEALGPVDPVGPVPQSSRLNCAKCPKILRGDWSGLVRTGQDFLVEDVEVP